VTIAADSDPGTTATIEVTASNESDGTCGPVVTETCSATATVTVVKPDLDICNGGSDLDNGDEAATQGALVPDDDEENIGAYILVNWDDDDGDGSMNADGSWSSNPVPDLYETFVQNEDNLAKLTLSIGSVVPNTGTVELETTGYDTQIRAWSASTKETEINLSGYPWTWDLGNPVQRASFQQVSEDGLWIEGYAPSVQERDVVFVLRYKDADGQELCSDTVKATVVMINLANAVYREGQIGGISGRGHSALVWKFIGPLSKDMLENDAKFLIIHMQGGGLVDNDNLSNITQSPGEYPWGCFTNPDITYVDRLRILHTAKSLAAQTPSIGYVSLKAALGNNNPQEPRDWDGKLNTIAELRCDGLVEVCYEINDVDVWGMVRTPDGGIVHYDITEYSDEWTYHEVMGGWDHAPNGLPDNLEEHNDFDSFPFDWMDTLQPATQCGHEPPVDADTKFQQQDLCIPVGSKGGN
ncbi:MAG: hypothetical protein WBE26_18870, partial [Phycisphaerae bacterium]